MAPTAAVLPAQSAFGFPSIVEGYSHPTPAWISASVPPGWPLALESPLVWTGEQFGTDTSHTYVLDEGEKEEIDAALHHFQSKQASFSEAPLRQLTCDSPRSTWERSWCTKFPAPDSWRSAFKIFNQAPRGPRFLRPPWT